MKEISAKNDQDLLTQLASNDISVPPIDAGRTTEHCERWSICCLLATLAKRNLLEYPLSILL
jgi:hypothetical protein